MPYQNENPKGTIAGFTLLEVLLAVVILGVAYLAILQNFSQSMRGIERLERNGARLFESQIKMEKEFLPGNLELDVEGEIFVEGKEYQVLLLTDGNRGKLASLSIKKL